MKIERYARGGCAVGVARGLRRAVLLLTCGIGIAHASSCPDAYRAGQLDH